ncbi:kinase-like protein [Lentithecium fluviatile CBS 122367]|uniref:Kinase-like protein n=1 Tax=Lentithecium fluviatile CBS 122367 TaxID=1168545 RepID=A0A6G1II97_9PLEO|nr:kinase-like protein [Lentithecium fluviatile CBS 122367]
MEAADSAKKTAASAKVSRTLLSPQEFLCLQEVYDAYLVFCENGSHRLAWRHLALCLTTYLKLHCVETPSGSLTPSTKRHANPARVVYLAHLGIELLGYLTEDVLWVLFRSNKLISNEDDRDWKQGLENSYLDPIWFQYGLRDRTREHISRLPEQELRVLLVDITNELNKRTPLSSNRQLMVNSTANLRATWNPVSGTSCGILPYLDVEMFSEMVPYLPPTSSRLQTELDELASRPAFYDLSKKFLRRALKYRTARPSKKTLSASSDSDNDTTQNLDSQKVADTSSAVIVKPKPLTPETKAPLLGAWLLRTDERTNVHPIRLTPILEDGEDISDGSNSEEENSDDEEGFLSNFTLSLSPPTPSPPLGKAYSKEIQAADDQSSWSDADSVATSQTLESLHDLYDAYSSRNASSNTLYTRSTHTSVDFGQLSRSELQQQLSQAIELFDDKLSIGSVSKRSDQSTLSAYHSFVTARSRLSVSRTSRSMKGSSIDSFVSMDTISPLNKDDIARTAYWETLKKRDLIPKPELETDWSGRGQHVEYEPTERDQIPLRPEKLLGQTRNALVESVRCKRVRLVRKLMRCNKWNGLKREDALREVQHLYRVQHSHIVRLVGTYVIGTDLAILTYPCAEWNLEGFMELVRTADDTTAECASLRQFFTCLAKVLDFMHSFPLKHMDIKPQNLLVRDIRGSSLNDGDSFKIYFTDFGISRSYDSVEECNTETPTSFTRTYAAIEVVLQESRGLSADIFSLGCVFAEMIATILDASTSTRKSFAMGTAVTHWDALRALRRKPEDNALRPYYSTTEEICAWLSKLAICELELQTVRDRTIEMLETDPNKRPTARQISDDARLPFACLSCTLRTGPEDFEAAEPLTPLQDPPPVTRASMEVPKPP